VYISTAHFYVINEQFNSIQMYGINNTKKRLWKVQRVTVFIFSFTIFKKEAGNGFLRLADHIHAVA
jgi:6-phosphogluconolactonase (cycloisomerase 2 family)